MLNYFNYFTETEEHFQRARGTALFLMSPLDWALVESWKNADVPLEAQPLPPAQDRRGQSLKPGTYTLRYSQHPVNGDHQGVAPQRDFAVLVRASDDNDPNSTPAFDALVALSAKASGTPHPAVLGIWNSASDKFPSFSKQNDHDWVLDAKSGDLGLSIILAGKAEG